MQRSILRNNFTLIELIAAAAILTMIAATIGLVLSTVYNSWRRADAGYDRLSEKLRIDAIVNTAFKNAVPFNWKTPDLKNTLLFTGAPDHLLLTCLHRVVPGESAGIRFLKLFREDDRLIAAYQDTPILNWNDAPGDNLRTEVIVKGIANISFLYADIDKLNGSVQLFNQWDETKDYIPQGIQLTIEWKNGEKESWFRRTAGNGHLQSFSLPKNY
jgi:hypothetical protein